MRSSTSMRADTVERLGLGMEMQGRRLAFRRLSAGVRQGIERRLGFEVHDVVDMPGGFTPGVAAAITSATGQRAFVKAISADLTPRGPEIYRREAAVSAALPEAAPAPRLRWWFDELGRVVLAFDHIAGRLPELGDHDDLGRVLDAVAQMGAVLNPSPVEVPTFEQAWGGDLDGWHRMCENGHVPRLAAFGQWVPGAVRRLARLESGWRDASRGTALLHGDLRTDNMLITAAGEVLFVDWPEACIGAPWVDLVTALPSFALAGANAEAIVRRHSLTASVAASDVDAMLAAIAGFFVSKSLLPPPPGLPTVREFQRAQGREALIWLHRRRSDLAG